MNVSPLARASRPAATTAAGRPKPATPVTDKGGPTTSDQAEQEAAIAKQRLQFDFALQERAELQREMNELRALEMEQIKRDDEIVKKWIALI
ncbi:MAG: hypothetical protein M3160_09405 [Candidatus Eremiobacteraeota bacterium]|nr:hypothetical protein [Candidatus Eremiobacteraeota bacterium]